MSKLDSQEDRHSSAHALPPALIALCAVLIALTTVFTLLIKIPTPARGYVNLSDVAITFAGLIFGPWVGMVAGGVGTALADLLAGFAPFAPLSLVAHGVEGFVIGWLGRGRRTVGGMIIAWLAGSLAMVAIYLLGEGLFYTGWAPALAEAPMNLFQALIGGVIGIPLVLAVRKAYPPIDRIGQRRQWTEE
jgi:uncharacterized membrane protein